MVDSRYCLERVVPGGISQVSRRSDAGNHKRRTLNTRLSSGTSAGTFAASAGPDMNYRAKAGTKNEPDTFFVPLQKKGWKIDPHVSNVARSNLRNVSILGTFPQNFEYLELFQVCQSKSSILNEHNSFQQIFHFKFSKFYYTSTSGAFPSSLIFFFRKEPSNICEKYWFTKDCSGGFKNPLHSPSNERSKTEFGKKSSRKSSKNRRLFPGANLILRPA